MGVDVYMNWNEQTEEEKACQITGFADAGEAGYLRGAYFGGRSDVLYELFNWMDWDNETPFNPEAYAIQLRKLINNGGERPGKGQWEHTKGSNFDLSDRQDEPLKDNDFKEYKAFLNLGLRLYKEGKNPTVYISY